MPLAHVVWPAAFEMIGPLAFALIVATVLVEAPAVKFALGTRWDDSFGAVFLGHFLGLLALVVVGIPFTVAFTTGATIDLGSGGWWSPAALATRARWIVSTLPGLLIPSARETLAWPGSSTLALSISAGASVLVQLLVVRSVCDLRWNLRNTGTLLAIAGVTVGAIVLLIRWPSAEADDAEGGADVEG